MTGFGLRRRRIVLATAGAAITLVALGTASCGTTSSTEVGVRTSLFGVLEGRGEQRIYAPGGVYLFLPIVNSWHTLPVSQQNLVMNANPNEGDRPVPDDVTFKTSDGNNVYIDVNVMWRINPRNAAWIVNHVGQSVREIKERVVRPVSRAIIRDIFNEIKSEDYYKVTTKNQVAAKAKAALERELSYFGILVDQLQVQQHRFDPEYQAAINAQKQAEADVQTLIEQQESMKERKKSELEGRRSQWNQKLADARGEAGRVRNEADGYYQTKTNEAKAILAVAQAESEGVRKEAEALAKLGGDAYVKMQVAKQFAQKRILLVPGSNVSTMDVNKMVDYLMGQQGASRREAPTAADLPAEKK